MPPASTVIGADAATVKKKRLTAPIRRRLSRGGAVRVLVVLVVVAMRILPTSPIPG
jgi:hypothetical protein